MPLLPGSPAIDAGNNNLIPSGVGNDQRESGFPRIQNGKVDIGAYETSNGTTSQTVSFKAIANQTYGVAPITLTASASSGRGVTFSVKSGPATISGNVLTITGAGTVVVEASQAGDSTYAPAVPVDQAFNVSSQATTMTVVSSINPADPTQAAIFTSTVHVGGSSNAPTDGSVQFIVDGVNSGLPVPVITTGAAAGTATSLATHLSPGQHAVKAVFTSATGDFSTSSAVLTSGQTVGALTISSLKAVLALNPAPTLAATTNADLQTIISTVNALAAQTTPTTIYVALGSGTFNDSTLKPNAGVTVVVTGNGTATKFVGHSPALVVTQGTVIVSGATFTTDSDSPTILVTGGDLILRDDVIESSTGYSTPAISVLGGGSLDLGTAGDPGGNTFDVNGQGEFIQNATGNGVPEVGDTFELNGVAGSIPTSTGFTSSAIFPVAGQDVTLTATVRASMVGLPAPTGTIDFYDATSDTDLTPDGVPVASDTGIATATISSTSLVDGNDLIIAIYSGDITFGTSQDSLTEILPIYVNAADTGTPDGLTPATGYATIQAAINAAAAGDTILVETGVYNESDVISVPNLTIEADAGQTPILDGTNLASPGPGFEIAATGVTVSGLTIRNFSGSSAVDVLTGASLTLADDIIEHNQNAGGNGGGVYDAGTLQVTGGAILDNAAADGGGIYVAGGTLAVVGGTIAGNSAVGATGATGPAGQAGGTGGSAMGGGLFESGGKVVLSQVFINSNRAVGGKGGDGGVGTTTGGGTGAGGVGGAGYGGGLYVGGGTLTVTGSTFARNAAVGGDGGHGGDGVLGASATRGASGIAGVGYGGGIDASGGSLTITNDTLADNSAGIGGGIAIGSGASGDAALTAINDTIADNTAGNAGGGLDVIGGTASLFNTIVALNTDASGAGDIAGTGIASISSNNLVGVDETGTVVGSIHPILFGSGNPGLDSGLAQNGGPTETIALSPGSAALGAGSSTISGVQTPNTDQRGVARTGYGAGLVDIGAYELPPASISTTLYVNSANTSGIDDGSTAATGYTTIQAAIDAAVAGDTILVETGFGYYESDTVLTPDLTIEADRGQSPVLDGTGRPVAGFDVNAANVTISGLTIEHFTGSGILVERGASLTLDADVIADNSAMRGGGVNNLGKLTVIDAEILGNVATSSGGGIYDAGGSASNPGGTVSISGGGIEGNSASGSGGAIFVASGTLTVTGTTVSNNSAGNGGGGIDDSGGLVAIRNGVIASNVAGANGGGIDAHSGTVHLTGGSIRANSAASGGGIYQAGGSLVITGTIVSQNSAGADGGGIDDSGGHVQVSGAAITNNVAGAEGGGIYGHSGMMTVNGGSSIDLNSAMSGGGIYQADGSLSLVDGALSSNVAEVNGGGLFEGGGTVRMTGGDIRGNAAASGGGIYQAGGSLSLAASTLAGNTAAFDGGGIDDSRGAVTIALGTIASNVAGIDGGGVYEGTGTVRMAGVTVEGNTATDGGGIYLQDGALWLTGNSLSNNTATVNGGGLADISGRVHMTGGSIDSNSAMTGGGIYQAGGSLSLADGISRATSPRPTAAASTRAPARSTWRASPSRATRRPTAAASTSPAGSSRSRAA